MRARFHRAAGFFLLGIAMLLGLCVPACDWETIDPLIETRGAFLFVQLSNVPPAARTVVLYGLLDLVPANELIVLPIHGEDTYTVGLRLAKPLAGQFEVNVGAFNELGCLLSAGAGEVRVTIGDDPDDDTWAIAVPLRHTPSLGSITCAPDDPALFAAAPETLDGSQPLAMPIELRGWGFRSGIQVTIGNEVQPEVRLLSYRRAIIDKPQLGAQRGPLSITVTLPDQRSTILPGALTVY